MFLMRVIAYHLRFVGCKTNFLENVITEAEVNLGGSQSGV